jgi:hypothetical protein
VGVGEDKRVEGGEWRGGRDKWKEGEKKWKEG